MAKTLATIDEKTIRENIPTIKMKEAFSLCCAVVRGERPVGDITANAQKVYDLQVLADKFTDLGKALSETVKNAEGKLFAETGSVSDGFKLKNTGSTVTVTDFEGLISTAILNGYNADSIKARAKLTISVKDATEAMGITKERFVLEFADSIEVKKKADSLIRAY